MKTETTKTATRLIPFTKWNDFHPWPTLGGLRHLRFNGDTNGFNACVVTIGRRVLIDEAAFLEWGKAHGAKATEAAA